MAENNRVAGTAYLKVDGKQYALRGGLKISIDSFEREGVAGQDGPHGFIEKAKIPFIEGEISDSGGLSLSDLRKIENATVTVELANGKVYALRNAWTASALELDGSEGKLTVRLEGMKCEEIKK